MKKRQREIGLLVSASFLILSACTKTGMESKPWAVPASLASELSGEAVYPAQDGAELAVTAPAPVSVPAETEEWVRLALLYNPSLRIAESRQQEAFANKDNVDAGFMPKVELGADTTRTRRGNEDVSDPAATSHSSRGTADLRIPIDVFGQMSSASEAADYFLTQRTEELEDSRLTVMRDVVLASVDAAEQRLLHVLNAEQLKTNRTSQKLTEFRYTKGQADIVDVLQQKDLVASLEQETPALVAGRQVALDTLSELAGKLPGSVSDAAFVVLPELPEAMALVAPESLLLTRPDLRALKAGLDAADSRLSGAIKDRLPSFEFSSSAVATLASGDISSVISGTLSAAFTLFDGGAKRATVRARRAELERFGTTYIEAWLRAVVEVDGLLAEEKRRAQEYELAVARLDNARKLHNAAERRYRLGASDYLPVLSAKRTIEQQERSLLSLQASLMRARVRLHTAMGGEVLVNAPTTAAL